MAGAGRLQLAYLALASDDFNEVVKVTDGSSSSEPENVRALLMRANAHAHWRQDPELALADAKRVLEIDPDATEAYEPLILALLGLGKLKEAGEALDEVGRRIEELGAGGETSPPGTASPRRSSSSESEQLEQARKDLERVPGEYPADPTW